ncbi:MAG: 3-hydroxyacyl-CoA dehydrogenase NAD-binding domain-containing protein [Granulosicoccaceae bacterium]
MGQFNYQKDADNIVTIRMDMDGPVNAMNQQFLPLLAEAADKLEAEKDLGGVIIASDKKTFFAGGDLNWLISIEPGAEAELFDSTQAIKHQLRRLEKLPVPVVAAINGAALGGGFEICLACNYRIAWDHRSVQLGLPEVTIGLLPGAGGIVRMTKLLGMEAAMPFVLKGKLLAPDKALAAGIIDATVESPELLESAAREWILGHIDDTAAAQQVWDTKGYKLPGGNANAAHNVPRLAAASAMLFKKTRGLLPGPAMILDLIAESSRLDFDIALRIESRKFAELVPRAEAKNMISAFFFDTNKIKGGFARPSHIAPSKVQKLGVVGAGMMGSGICFVAAKAGIAVVLKDIDKATAERGKSYSAQLMEKRIATSRASEKQRDELLARITTTDNTEDLQGCDLIIEAVFERIDLKDTVLRETQSQLAEDGVWASNTSTLPISRLAQGSTHPEKFIGLHFFSPVDRMPLLEIVVGDKTDDETLARALDFAHQIKLTPMVVNDSTGFYTSRTIATKIDEAIQMVAEGVAPARVENLGRAIGMPAGMLTVQDEVSLSLTLDIHDTQVAMGLRQAEEEQCPEARALVRTMVEEYSRPGRKGGGGFYDYNGRDKKLWAGLSRWYKPELTIDDQDIKDRLLFRAVIETLKCLEENVLRSVPEANIGSILGIGAPVWTGGYIQFVNTYGVQQFVDRCEQLALRYGERFDPPAIAREHASSGRLF